LLVLCAISLIFLRLAILGNLTGGRTLARFCWRWV
jgi:hypothetical protein